MERMKMMLAAMFMVGCFVVGGVSSAMAVTMTTPETFIVDAPADNSYAVGWGYGPTNALDGYSLYMTDGTTISSVFQLENNPNIPIPGFYNGTGHLTFGDPGAITPETPFSFFMSLNSTSSTRFLANQSEATIGGVKFNFLFPDSTIFVYVTVENIKSAPVPLPATALLFGSGLLGILGIGRRKKTS